MKKQTLMYKNGYAVPVPMGQQEEVAALEQQFDAMWTVPAAPIPSTAPFTPKFVQFDKQVSWTGPGRPSRAEFHPSLCTSEARKDPFAA